MVLRALSRVLVFYHRGLRTGGPEAQHQLVDALRRQGRDAHLVPIPGTERRPRVEEYDRYDAPELPLGTDVHQAAVVVPETWLRGLLLPAGRRFCWWLSVDNSPLFAAHKAGQRTTGSMLREGVRRRRYARVLLGAEHLAQSCYAATELTDVLRLQSRPLSDYITLPVVDDVPAPGRRPVVAFNPAKGGDVARRLRAGLDADVEWLPLEGLTSQGVRDALLRADVYVELGHMPGKDRLPREAAACGAVVLALAQGAAANDQDLPLPREHKLQPTGNVVAELGRLLVSTVDDLVSARGRQQAFRGVIAQERSNFDAEVRAVFDARADRSTS